MPDTHSPDPTTSEIADRYLHLLQDVEPATLKRVTAALLTGMTLIARDSIDDDTVEFVEALMGGLTLALDSSRDVARPGPSAFLHGVNDPAYQERAGNDA